VSKESISDDRSDQPSHAVEEETIAPDLVREELHRIVTSRHFRTSRRGKEFLEYVVDQKIRGNGDLLKERLIGVQIFGRKPDYATGEDPVVRVQAGDVRRRLECYHADTDIQSDILIQIPLGCYAPIFQLKRGGQAHETSAGEITKPVPAGPQASGVAYALPEDVHESSVDYQKPGYGTSASATTEPLSNAPNEVRTSESKDHQTTARPEADATFLQKRGRRRGAILKRAAIPILACLALVVYLVTSYFHKSPESALKSFWLPASVSSKPVLLCLPKPMVYRPSDKLFDRYENSHPNAFVTREARQDQILPLEPTDTIQWGDMVPARNAGPGIGGVIAAINMSKLLTEQDIRFELRFGEEARYAEMRDSPVVIVGAINTDWATQLTSESNFVFDETRGAPNIRETGGAKRVWKMETSNGHITRDYGLITRQLSGKAGQFLVQVAGISHFGTEAASEMLVQQQELAKVLRSESISLQKKNLQIVVSTDVTDERAGPPHVVAVSSW
jgi:hypothetical protein